ncbi:MAG: pyruvate kinase, partial [Candidatus Dadabacteria bacterium]
MRRAKIVCTIGPASAQPETLRRMVEAGMDVARLNMSHGDHGSHARTAERIREAAAAAGRPVALLLDLAGPKIRLGALPEPRLVHAGDELVLGPEASGAEIPVTYPDLASELAPGDRLSLADGAIPLEVAAVDPPRVRVRVLSGGTVTSHKGLNLPGKGDALPAVSEKDREDLRFGLRIGVDWVALSFVRSPRDLDPAREIMDQEGVRAPVLAKIEKRQALARLGEILDVFDGLMVARGDLGVEVDLEEVPGIQKRLIREANRRAKPVVTATQMLLSMVTNPRPTRAEVTDVANAVLDGTDAVMLSEETAMGRHPVESVAVMARIVERAEADAPEPEECRPLAARGVPAAIARATWHVARDVGAKAIVTPTRSGSTARLVAGTRPPVPVLGMTSDPATAGALALTWGVTPALVPP